MYISDLIHNGTLLIIAVIRVLPCIKRTLCRLGFRGENGAHPNRSKTKTTSETAVCVCLRVRITQHAFLTAVCKKRHC